MSEVVKPWELSAGPEMNQAMAKLFKFGSKPVREQAKIASTVTMAALYVIHVCLRTNWWGIDKIVLSGNQTGILEDPYWECEIQGKQGTTYELGVVGEGTTLAEAFCRAILCEE